MIHFIKKRKSFSRIEKLSVTALFVAIALSLIDTIWAVYAYGFLKNDSLVGLTSTLFTIVSLLSFIYFIPFIEKHDKSKLYEWALFLSAICYILFAITPNFLIFVLLGMFLSMIMVIRIDCFGILVKDYSKKNNLARNEGLIYAITNLGWIIGPLIASYIAERYDIALIFLLSSFFLFMALVTYKVLNIVKEKENLKKTDNDFWKNVKEYFKNKNLVKTYIVSGSASFWWSFIFIYMPLYILQQGLDLSMIAYFLFAVVIPVVLLEYFFGSFANKIRYKRLFIWGNLWIILTLIICFFVVNIYWLMALLILGTIGIAMKEPTTEAYFFLVAPKKGIEKSYSVYNTALDVFSIISKLFVAGILAILSFKYSFLFLAFIFGIFLIVSLRMKEVSKNKR